MNNQQKVLNLLGLALRANKLVSGEDTVIREVRKRTIKLVIIATDASDNAKKMVSDKCSYYQVPYEITFTQLELSQAIGKKRVVIGVKDQGFAKKMTELLR